MTFGIKTKNSVTDVQQNIKIVIKTKEIFLFLTIKLITEPVVHINRTLYTHMPICLESFNAVIVTCLVS
jgi:hypothetical protein